MKQIVWVKSPRAGLGNKLLVWANGLVYSKLNNTEFVTTGWVSIFVGPIIRGEDSLRFYSGYFNNDGFLLKLKLRLLSFFYKKKINPSENADSFKEQILIFNEVKFWMHFFDNIREHRSFIRENFFFNLLKKKHLDRYRRVERSKISVHVRMGDFKEIKVEDEFQWNKSVLERTPLDYFIEVITEVRNIVGKNQEVILFSDGSEDELAPIMELSNIRKSKNEKDIDDLLQLSKSEIIITSASSTFSLLAGYLSDAILIHHPNFYMRPVRDESFNQQHYEGPFLINGELNQELMGALRTI